MGAEGTVGDRQRERGIQRRRWTDGGGGREGEGGAERHGERKRHREREAGRGGGEAVVPLVHCDFHNLHFLLWNSLINFIVTPFLYIFKSGLRKLK